MRKINRIMQIWSIEAPLPHTCDPKVNEKMEKM